MALSDEVKARTSLVKLVEETVTWDVKKSKPAKGDYWAPCPFHGENSASFHVTEKAGTRGTYYCFGCQAKGSAIDYLMARDGISFTAAVRTLADAGQVERTTDPAHLARIKAQSRARQDQAEERAAQQAAYNHRMALTIWRGSDADAPELVAYLEGRGIKLAPIGGVPPSLRYHVNLSARDGSGEVIHTGPAMVGFIGRKRFLGVHRTWINGPARARLPDGRKVPKSMLGLTGSIYGMPVPLTKQGGPFMFVGEGIETTLAALSRAYEVEGGPRPSAEAALSLGAMCGPEDNSKRCGGMGRAGKPLPSAVPDFASDNLGWLPPRGTPRALILGDPSTKCPDTARLNAERAVAKIAPRCAQGARLVIPRGSWDHDDDFADLALKGEF